MEKLSSDFNRNVVIQSVIPEFKEIDFPDREVIGEGFEAIVVKSFHGDYGDVAIKMHKRPRILSPGTSSSLEEDLHEAEILIKHSRHPNIVQVYGLLTSDKPYFSRFLGYIMDYMNFGSLARTIHDPDVTYSMKQVFSWIRQASIGLKHLHNSGIIHRDVKPANFLLGKSRDDLKISDFGLAKTFNDSTSITRGIGTTDYMSPELIDSQRYSFPSDIYALTISIWEMANREKPYKHISGLSNYLRMTQIVQENKRPPIIGNSPLESLMKRGWDRRSEHRPELAEFISFAHKELQKADDNRMIRLERETNPRKLTKGETNLIDHESLVLISGGHGSMDVMFIFDYKNNSWMELFLRLPYETHGHAMLLLNEEIYVFGGSKEDIQFNCTYKLNSQTMEWEKLANMNHKRYGITCSSVVFDGCLWAIGGWSGSEGLKSVEKYDPSTGRWTLMPSMNEGKVSGSSAIFDGKIYSFGGYSGRHFPEHVEVMDPISAVWTLFCPFPKHRQGLVPIITSTNLLILGGWDSHSDVSNCWKLNLAEESPAVEELPDMVEKRANFTAHKFEEEIVVFGGTTVEVFDGISWSRKAFLPERKFFHASIKITPKIVKIFEKCIV